MNWTRAYGLAQQTPRALSNQKLSFLIIGTVPNNQKYLRYMSLRWQILLALTMKSDISVWKCSWQTTLGSNRRGSRLLFLLSTLYGNEAENSCFPLAVYMRVSTVIRPKDCQASQDDALGFWSRIDFFFNRSYWKCLSKCRTLKLNKNVLDSRFLFPGIVSLVGCIWSEK